MSKPRSKIKKEFHQTSKDSFSLENNWKMAELSVTTTSKRNQLSISFSDFEVVCKSSSKLSLVRPLPLMSSQQIPSKTLRPKSKTKKESHQINKDSFLPESSLRMAEHSLTTISRRNPHFT